jgi:hypothetical protein
MQNWQVALHLIKQLNKDGYLVNVDFNPDGTGAASIMHDEGADTWQAIAISKPTTDPVQAIIQAYDILANVEKR